MREEIQFELVGVAEVRGVDMRTIAARDGGDGAEEVVFENTENTSPYSLLGESFRRNPQAHDVARTNAREPRSIHRTAPFVPCPQQAGRCAARYTHGRALASSLTAALRGGGCKPPMPRPLRRVLGRRLPATCPEGQRVGGSESYLALLLHESFCTLR